MEHKIKKKDIEILFPIIALMEPGLFSAVDLIDNIWSVFKIVSILYISVRFFYKHKVAVSAMQLISIAFFLTPLVSSIMNGESIIYAVRSVISITALVFYFDNIIRKYKTYAVKLVSGLMTAYITINTVCLIIFPNGFGPYIPGYNSTEVDLRLNFLGLDNTFIYFFIFAIATCVLSRGLKSITTVFTIIMSLGSMLFVWSGTGVVGVLLIVAYLLFAYNKKIDKYIKFFPLSIAFIIIFVLIVVYNVQAIFSDFIASFLHKDITLTGRVYLWTQAFERIARKPLLGYGITVTNMLERHGNFYSPHNIILQILLAGGCIQLILFIALVFFAGERIKSCKYEGLISMFIFIYMFCSLTEATMLSGQLYLLLCLAYNIGTTKTKTKDLVNLHCNDITWKAIDKLGNVNERQK